jgi:hypothetical protein
MLFVHHLRHRKTWAFAEVAIAIDIEKRLLPWYPTPAPITLTPGADPRPP